ncbi:hypothetical protein [Planktotalea sp.]|uniref:hypothetical protein n=1 Tax=Planktotalea sp. TaxID=2029877 RepID=UPI003D6B9E04
MANAIFVRAVPNEVSHGSHELLRFSGGVALPSEALKRSFPDLDFDHLPNHWWYAYEEAGGAVPAEPMALFQYRIAQFAVQLNDVNQEAIAIVGHGNAFQKIIELILNNCAFHQYR